MNILIIILLMTSCAGIQNLNKEKEEKKFNYEVKSIEVFNGKVKYVQLDLPRKAKEHKLICQEVDKKDAKKRKILFSKVQKHKLLMKNKVVQILSYVFFTDRWQTSKKI